MRSSTYVGFADFILKPLATFALKPFSSVKGLLSRCSPAAILWMIVTIIIYSIQSLAFWALTHVSKKVLKIKPSIADGYSAILVRCFAVIAFIKASLHHGSPRPICATGRGFFPKPMSVFKVCDTTMFIIKATARLYMTAFNISCRNIFRLPADTQAFPSSTTSYYISSKFNNGKPIECLSCKIRSFCHDIFSFVFTFRCDNITNGSAKQIS